MHISCETPAQWLLQTEGVEDSICHSNSAGIEDVKDHNKGFPV